MHHVLQAAKSLQEQSKAKVTLLEASTAVGGRARSVVVGIPASIMHAPPGPSVSDIY